MVSRNAMEGIAERAIQQGQNLATEEAAKHALVLPFIQALGYDVFDPTEVVPEFTADYGLRHGEKVDYAIMRDGEPAILFECKKVSDPLDATRAAQLARYFHQTPARIAILTDGIIYKFFSDLDAENTMDSTPFLEIDITKLEPRDFNALNHFSRPSFDVDEARAAASNMKYISGMKAYLASAYGQPDEEFVRFLARKVFSGPLFQSRVEHFSSLVKLAFQGFVNDRINNTLQRASDIVNTPSDNADSVSAEDVDEHDEAHEDIEGDGGKSIVTTVEEVQGYEMVRTILGEVIDTERVFIRDTRSYCGVLLDNNNRKPICRLHFNRSSRKYLGFLNEDRTETRYFIDSIDEISSYGGKLRESLARYLQED